MRVRLVLGARGVMGGARLTGGLDAIVAKTGPEPASADRVVDTAAGGRLA